MIILNTKLRSQQSSLFISYSILIACVLLVCFSVFYFYYVKNITENASSNAYNLCDSISNSVSLEIDKISTVSMNVIYSNIIHDNLKVLMAYYSRPFISRADRLSKNYSADAIYNTISAIIGPFQAVTQVNLYSNNGTAIGSGFYQYNKPLSVSNKTWYESTLEKMGDKYITTPEFITDIPSISSNLKGHKFISLCRVYFDKAYESKGIVEVVQDCETIFSFVNNIATQNKQLEIYILNDRDEVMYPYEYRDNNILYYNKLIKDIPLNTLNSHIVNHPTQNAKQMITYTSIPKLNWTVIVNQSQSTLLAPVKKFSGNFLLLISLALLVTLVTCFLVSRRVTIPLNHLTQTISQVNVNDIIDNPVNLPALPKSKVEELHTLFESFTQMYTKLHYSSQELINTKSEETRAKMMAMQSMINPHFLYNNLTTISIMAEENMNEDITLLCNNLCDYLRYITTDTMTNVSLQTELLHTEKYLACIKTRYGTDLNYSLNVPTDLNNIHIPKLIIQPIVENIIKHGLNTPPPWFIKIYGNIEMNHWLIHIEDNGIGITELGLEKLKEQMNEIKQSKDISSLHIGGMGILNVYLRLVFLYDKDAIFIMNNIPTGGLRVTLGGKI